MSKIDFRAKYGSAGSKEVYFARLQRALGKPTLVDLIKASFGGDRSAAGRYAANMRWQGNVKDESSGGSSGALAEVLQPTFDAEVAKATGRPWAPMMTENFPPELISSYEKYRSEWLAHYKKLYEFDIKMRVEKMPVWDEEADKFWKTTSLEERKLRSGQVEKSLNKSISNYAEKLVGKGILSEKIAAAIKERLVFQVNQDNEFSEWSAKDPEDSKNFDPKEMLMDENLRVVVRAPNNVVAKILSDGRIKSQHETYTSGGALDPSLRSRAEGRMFNQHPDTVKEMRPIYGSVLVNGVDGQSFRPGREYGDVGIVLKKDIKSRTTFTSRDSLAVGTQPSPILQPNKSSYFPDSFGGGYIEAQIHGQVKVSDIAYIVGNFSNKDLLGEVEKAAKSLGIPIYDTKDPYNTDFKVEETGDMTKARGRLVAVRGSEQKLFHTHDEVSKPFGMTMRMGYIKNADGRRFDVNVDSALARGYWTDPDAMVSKSLIDLLKASFGGDRSAAGRYAAEQRWKGNRKAEKPKGKKRVSAVERTKDQKMSDGPLLVNGRDKFGFPKLLSVADGEKKFGKTIEEIKNYFKKRGLKINLEPEIKVLVQPPELYASLQAVDDVLNAIKTETTQGETFLEGTKQVLPQVTIKFTEESGELVGGSYDNTRIPPEIIINAGIMSVFGKLIGQGQGSTIPQLSASISEGLSKTSEFSKAVTYGFTVHEFGHYLDHAMRQGSFLSFWSKDMKSALSAAMIYGKNSKIPNKPLEGLSSDFKAKGEIFVEIAGRYDAGLREEPGMGYGSTNIVEKFAETFTSWFLMSQAKSVLVERAKANLKTRGSDFVIEKITEVVKQAIIKDDLSNLPEDHPILLFALGRMQDTDAMVSKSLIELLKTSFGGDRSAAGRYAAEQRWKGNRKADKPKTERKKKDEVVLNPLLSQAMKLLDANFGDDVIGVLRNELTASRSFRGPGANKFGEITDVEKNLASSVEEAGKLISKVIDDQLLELEQQLSLRRDALNEKATKLKSEVAIIAENDSKFINGWQEVSAAQFSQTYDAVEAVIGPPKEGVNFESNKAGIEVVTNALRSAKTQLLMKLVLGEVTFDEATKMSDKDLLKLTARDKSKWPSKGRTRVWMEENRGDSELHESRPELRAWSLEDKETAFLKVLRQQLNGDLGNYTKRELPKLGSVVENSRKRTELKDANTELTNLKIDQKQRENIVKSVLSSIGVKFGKPGQVPVSMQFKTVTGEDWRGRKIKDTNSRKADETPTGRKYQALVDEVVQLLPSSMLRGSNNTVTQGSNSAGMPSFDDGRKATVLEIDVKNGRAHAQKLLAFPGVSQTTKLKLNAVKLGEEASPKWKSTLLHETGHALEFNNEWLTQLEYAYFTFRAKGERDKPLRSYTTRGYKSTERGVQDAWKEPYAGKLYASNRTANFEIFTTGIQNIYHGDQDIDLGQRGFVLGLLALSTKIKD